MRSRTPKILHPLCGRPMLAYVLDAWDDALGSLNGSGGAGAAGSERGSPLPWSCTRPPPRPSATSSAIVAPRAPGRAPRNRRCRARRPRGAAGGRRARSSSSRATCRWCIGEQLVAVVEQRRLDDAAIALASVYAADPARARAGSSGASSARVERIVEARDASPRGARDERGQRRALRLRRGLAAAPDRLPHAHRSRTASCTSPISWRSHARTAGS